MSTVLVTGVDGGLARLTALLLAEQGAQVIGVAHQPPATPLDGVALHVLELRGPQLRELLTASAVDAVVHLAQPGEEQPLGRAGGGHVLATVELLSACAAAGVRRVVLRSSTLVYGARLGQPLLRTEDAPLRLRGRGNPRHDDVEVERFAAGFARKNPGTAVTVLRCASVVGGEASSPLARYLARMAPPVLLGYDPLIQVLHAGDAALMFALAALVEGVSGAFNLAAASPLPLSQAVRLAGRQPLPLLAPAFALGGALGGLTGMLPRDLPFPPEFFRFACLADTHKAVAQLDFTPRHTAQEALQTQAAVADS
ncbi:MAG TPA: NAD-dependent epimerase/dehydratase family protein [Roseiflexaceae bacterium]|nr:NAD-dependent epimerase/dehydratase family protein [Roseiflexaceae bacterium]